MNLSNNSQLMVVKDFFDRFYLKKIDLNANRNSLELTFSEIIPWKEAIDKFPVWDLIIFPLPNIFVVPIGKFSSKSLTIPLRSKDMILRSHWDSFFGSQNSKKTIFFWVFKLILKSLFDNDLMIIDLSWQYEIFKKKK